MATTETGKARKIVTAAIDAGYTVSVYDGAEWTVRRSITTNTICAALATTGMDTLRLRNANGDIVGAILLVWGNAKDGSELPADWSDNDATNAVLSAAGY